MRAVHAMDWRNVDWPVAHAAAVAWQAVKAGEPLTVLSLEPGAVCGHRHHSAESDLTFRLAGRRHAPQTVVRNGEQGKC